MTKSRVQDKAEADFRATQKAKRSQDRSEALSQYQSETEARSVLTARLKSLRLARDAEQAKSPPVKRAVRPRKTVARPPNKASADPVDTSPRETAKRDWLKSWRD